MRVVNRRSGQAVAEQAVVARGLVGRLRGLMGRDGLPKGGALIIPGCRQIHTFCMRFPIDAVFTDSAGNVVALNKGMVPWKVSGRCAPAAQAIELPAGTISAHDIRLGDLLDLVD